jgi:metaxin
MPDQATFDKAVALAQLITGRIRPAVVSSSRATHLDLPIPSVLAAGLTTPLPASLTGDTRDVDMDLLQHRADEAWDAVEAVVEDGWGLGTR